MQSLTPIQFGSFKGAAKFLAKATFVLGTTTAGAVLAPALTEAKQTTAFITEAQNYKDWKTFKQNVNGDYKVLIEPTLYGTAGGAALGLIALLLLSKLKNGKKSVTIKKAELPKVLAEVLKKLDGLAASQMTLGNGIAGKFERREEQAKRIETLTEAVRGLTESLPTEKKGEITFDGLVFHVKGRKDDNLAIDVKSNPDSSYTFTVRRIEKKTST